VSVNNRVSDIWRSYITLRLLWDIGLRIPFTPPQLVRKRYENSPLKLYAKIVNYLFRVVARDRITQLDIKNYVLSCINEDIHSSSSSVGCGTEPERSIGSSAVQSNIKDKILAQKWPALIRFATSKVACLNKIRYFFQNRFRS